jgi:hypothetical protein
MTKRFAARAFLAPLIVLTMLAGCAELDTRGGTVAVIQDNVLFVARTKSHRLFRSYLLIGVLVAAARQGAHNQADAAAIEGSLKSALSVAFEAYDCLYGETTKPGAAAKDWVTKATTAKIGTVGAIEFEPPAVCQFFDEKMARLDYALYRLALSSLFNPESSIYLTEIRDKLMGEIPVVSATAKAAIYANKAANQATNVVDDLLNLSFSSAGPVVTLLPLYRDSLEMNMWVIVDTLTRRGNGGAPCTEAPASPAFASDGMPVAHYAIDCATRDYAYYVLHNGNGYLPLWRDFVRQMIPVAYDVEAYAPHFALVTRLIWRSCKSLLIDSCENVMTDAAKIATGGAMFVDIPGPGRQPYSASIAPSTRLARQPIRGPSRITTAPAAKPAPAQSGDSGQRDRNLDSTGSITPAAPAGR